MASCHILEVRCYFCTDEEDGNLFERFDGMNSLIEFDPVHVGKPIIQDNQLRYEISYAVFCLCPLRGKQGLIGGLLPDRFDKQGSNIQIILNDDNRCRFCAGFLLCSKLCIHCLKSSISRSWPKCAPYLYHVLCARNGDSDLLADWRCTSNFLNISINCCVSSRLVVAIDEVNLSYHKPYTIDKFGRTPLTGGRSSSHLARASARSFRRSRV